VWFQDEEEEIKLEINVLKKVSQRSNALSGYKNVLLATAWQGNLNKLILVMTVT
jgi:hypothetical protein